MASWCIVLAAGSGARFGAQKQFATIGGHRLVDLVVSTVKATCDHVVLVLPPTAQWSGVFVDCVVAGGSTRSQSVAAALAVIPIDTDVIVIHDAAHPLAAAQLFLDVVAAVRGGADAALPGIPLTDPLKRVDAGAVVENVSREHVLLVQTPHAFRGSMLRTAHALGVEAIEETALVEQLGGFIAIVPGDPVNIHVTTPVS